MVTLEYNGRLGNSLIQYVTSLFFAKKFNLQFKNPPFCNSDNWGLLIKEPQIDGLVGKENKNMWTKRNEPSFIGDYYYPVGYLSTLLYYQIQ